MDDSALRRRKSDRYERPQDDHDLLTSLWVMFIHFCDEQGARHLENSRSVAELRKEVAEHRASQNFKVDGLESAFEAKLESLRSEVQALRERDLKQVGAFELFKIAVATAASSAVVVTLVLKLVGVIP